MSNFTRAKRERSYSPDGSEPVWEFNKDTNRFEKVKKGIPRRLSPHYGRGLFRALNKRSRNG